MHTLKQTHKHTKISENKLLLLLLLFILMQDINKHIYISDTNHVWSNVAVILWLKFMVNIMLLPTIIVRILAGVLYELCSQYSIWLFTVLPWFRAFPVGCSGIFRMILRSVQLPLLLLASLLFLNSTSVTFLLQSLCISTIFAFFFHYIYIFWTGLFFKMVVIFHCHYYYYYYYY